MTRTYAHVTKKELFSLLSEAKKAETLRTPMSLDAQTLISLINEILDHRRTQNIDTFLSSPKKLK